MSQRSMRIKINPHNRYDLSHLTPEEGSQTLKHFMEDLCFWGNLPLPRTFDRSQTPPYYYDHHHHHNGNNNEQHAMMIRQQSSGDSDSKNHKKKKKDNNSSLTAPRELPPRGGEQARVWKTAVDPSTGQTYYYDPVSRQTQWEKVRFACCCRIGSYTILSWLAN